MKKNIKFNIYILLLVVLVLPIFAIAATPAGGYDAGANGAQSDCPGNGYQCINGWGVRVTLVYYDYDKINTTVTGDNNRDAMTPIAAYIVKTYPWASSKLKNSGLKKFEGKTILNGVIVKDDNTIAGVSTTAINPWDKGVEFAAWVEDTKVGIFGSKQPQGIKSSSNGCKTPARSRPTECDFAAKFGLKLWDYTSNEAFDPTKHVNTMELGKYYLAVEPVYETYTRDDSKANNGKGTGNVTVARTGGHKNYLKSIANPGGGTKNLFADANGNNKTWYVGPSEESALVGTKSYHPYQLVPNNQLKNKINSNGLSQKIKGVDGVSRKLEKFAGGVAFYYFSAQCRDFCAGKTGDDRLICAEKFCDATNPYNPSKPDAKGVCVRECAPEDGGQRCTDKFTIDQVTEIKAYCKDNWQKDDAKYTSEKDCVDMCSSEESTSCQEDDPYVNDPTKPNIGVNTECGSVEGGYKVCDNSEPNHAAIDARKYYTVSCVEKSKFDYYDTSKKLLTPGEGLYYDVKLNGNKTCKVFFDVKSWQIDYASINSKDPDASKNLAIMEKYITDFNKAFAPKNPGGIAGDIATFKEILKISDNYIEYNVNKVEITTQFKEVIAGKDELSKTYYLVKEDKMKSTDVITNEKTVDIKLINQARPDSGKTEKLNYYQAASNREVNYLLKGQCLTSNGHATSYEVEEGVNCQDGTTPKRLYYTSLKAMTVKDMPSGKRHEVITNAKAVDGGNVAYAASKDVCEFKFNCTDEDCPEYKNKCVITVKSGQRVPGIENGFTGDVELELALSSDVSYVGTMYVSAAGIDTVQTFNPTSKEWLKTIKDPLKKCTNTPIVAYGKIIMKDLNSSEELSIDCELPLNFVGNCDGDLACKITDVKKNVYEIQATGRLAGSALYYYSINGKDEIKLNPDANNGKYYINTANLTTSIVGVVKADGMTAYCPAGARCTENFQMSEPTAIANYCRDNWSTDLAGYTSAKECEDKCKVGCTDPGGCGNGSLCENQDDCPMRCVDRFQKDDVAAIKEYCTKYWDVDLGMYKNADDCITGCTSVKTLCNVNIIPNPSYESIYQHCNTNPTLKKYFGSVENCATMCCADTGICSGSGYIYRPVDKNNPFPDSYLNGTDGSRPIGANWYGKQDLITKKTDEKAANGDEYVIKLNSSTIKAIKQSSVNYNKELIGNDEIGNVYVNYIYSEDAANRNSSSYESKFIHDSQSNGGFNHIFEVINREPVK